MLQSVKKTPGLKKIIASSSGRYLVGSLNVSHALRWNYLIACAFLARALEKASSGWLQLVAFCSWSLASALLPFVSSILRRFVLCLSLMRTFLRKPERLREQLGLCLMSVFIMSHVNIESRSNRGFCCSVSQMIPQILSRIPATMNCFFERLTGTMTHMFRLLGPESIFGKEPAAIICFS